MFFFKMGTHLVITIVLYLLMSMYDIGVLSHSSKQYVKGRVKRQDQDGYVYDKPSISFNLPTRPSPTVSTQAPTFDRPQEQQMYYAYPVPAGGDTVNIGYSTGGTSSTTAATTSGVTTSVNTGGGGYNYGTQNTATSTSGNSGSGSNAGYNYNTPTSTTSLSGNPSSGSNGGYNYNTPLPTAGTTAGSTPQIVASTNAPKYLPPTSGGGAVTGGSVSVNVPNGGSTTAPSVPVSTITQTSSTDIALPNTNYLPPLPNQQPSTGISQSPVTPLPKPTAGYLPPLGSPTPSVPTPVATYLPPVL